MDSAMLKDTKNKRKKKFRKKPLDAKLIVSEKSAKDAEPLCNPKRKKKKHSFKERKGLIFEMRKMPKNESTFNPSVGHTANEVSSNTDIEGASNASEKEVIVSSKAERRAKKLKKKITNNNVAISKNTNGKRKHFHSDIEFSSTKEDKNVARKKSRSPSSKVLSEFTTINTNSSKNGNCEQKNSVFQDAQIDGTNESDSDEDREIRNELKSSSIFNSIQKLLKDNPSMLSTVNVCDEEFIETESLKSLCESDLEEESIECSNDMSTDEEPEIVKKDLSIPTSNKNKKVKLSVEKGCNRTQNDSKVNENEENTVTASTTSSFLFNRTQKNSFTDRDEKVISKKGASSLRDKALEKLQGAKFRYLNEKLYTESGGDSFDYFQKNKDEYMDYHKGYSLQVTKWPMNPVDKIISSLQKMKKNIIIADMGCGDAKIAHTLSNCTVHSFDLVALNDFVTPCNISKVPLSNESVDVVVFCLSLMGTNLKEYLQEAYRIAKLGGILKIAEVESRIPNLDQFIKSIEALGFSIEKKDVEHKLFVFLEFKKMKKKKKSATVQNITLKPCFYKKR